CWNLPASSMQSTQNTLSVVGRHHLQVVCQRTKSTICQSVVTRNNCVAVGTATHRDGEVPSAQTMLKIIPTRHTNRVFLECKKQRSLRRIEDRDRDEPSHTDRAAVFGNFLLRRADRVRRPPSSIRHHCRCRS